MLDILLFALIVVGNAVVVVPIMSWFYGRPWDRNLLFSIRLLVAAWLAAWPVLALLDHGLGVAAAWSAGRWSVLVTYEIVCAAFAAVVLPAVTVARHLRPVPDAVVEETSEVVDMAERLGGPPAGGGRKGQFARLPGNQIFQVEFTRLRLRLDGWPAAWDGLTVLQVSDLHFHGTPTREYFHAVVDECDARFGTPDLVAVTGDIVDKGACYPWIGEILGRLRWRVAGFAILGNHDWWERPGRVREELRRLGYRDLGNRREAIDVRGEPMVVVGHEGPWFKPPPDLSNGDGPGYRVCLSHSPDNFRWARRHGVGLMLSGHNHGGQLRLPVIGSIFVPSVYGRRYDQGTFYRAPTLMHVNRGVGGKSTLRYFCRPQVTWLVLESGRGA